MNTKTYSELRQAALFRCGRDLLKVAALVLDDVVNPVELANPATLEWAKSVARKSALLAEQSISLGHEQGIATSRQDNDLYGARRQYSAAVDRFEGRIKAARIKASIKAAS